MSIPDAGEEKALTLSELAALAEDLDRQLAQANSKARGRANQARAKRGEVSEKDLLAKYGGKKAGSDIIFGSEGETQLVFRPSKGWMGKLAARWTVCLSPVPLSGYDTQRELSRYGRELWNKEKGEATLAFKAVEQLLAYHVEIERLRKLQLRRRLEELLLWRLREKAKQEGVSLIEPDEAAEETPCTYPKPEIDTLREQLSVAKEQLDTGSVSLIRASDAISLAFEALSKGLGGKMQIAFKTLRDYSQCLQGIEKLRWHAVDLARELQRPPTKAELRKSYDPDEGMDPAQFSRLLKPAGLTWLPGAKPPRKLN